jgi:hypothetical protein
MRIFAQRLKYSIQPKEALDCAFYTLRERLDIMIEFLLPGRKISYPVRIDYRAKRALPPISQANSCFL